MKKSNQGRQFRFVVIVLMATNVGQMSAVGLAQEPAQRGMSRAASTSTDSESVPRYRRQWAVLVGINYRHLSGATAAEVPPLSTAENDAQTLFDVLATNYGYERERMRLLLGPEATRESIRSLFGEGFIGDPDQVTSEDSVLFYFAGHGNRRERAQEQQQYVGLLYPADIRVLEGKGVDTVSCLRIDELMVYLRDYCPARHKLVVLDSCHSGEVFSFQSHRSAGVHRGFRAELFRRPAFQAIAAARGFQQAGDADETGEHSPVTRALLDALTLGPGSGDRKLFTASELFSYIPNRVAAMKNTSQDPRGGWIAGDGDFYFFPRSLTAADIPERERREFQLTLRGGASMSAGAVASPDSLGDAKTAAPIWIWWLAGGIGLAIATSGIVWRLRSSGTPAPVRGASDATRNATAGPRIGLRILETPHLYQAPAGVTLITVGRQRRKEGETAEAGNDFVIRLPDQVSETLKISRRHFEIRCENNQLWLVDRSSAGTDVNGQRVERGQPSPLAPGDRITVAGVLTMEVMVIADTLPGRLNAQVSASLGTTGAPPLILQASVGDMVTVDPDD